MLVFAKLLLMAALLIPLSAQASHAGKKTVCTITVNSPDEKEMFRRYLPADKFDFVELVEQGRPDWLESACRAGVRCDALIVSGHFDDGNEFFSERIDADEFLPVAEMERVSCSASCPGLFSQLKEVYLFGCNTLNAQAIVDASTGIERSVMRSPLQAVRASRTTTARHDESSRDRMRQIFANVPVIYGFSSVAPLGPTAAATLNRYFRAGGAAEVARGRPSANLLAHFRPHSMAVASGLSDTDPRALHRRDVCQFADDRLSPAQKLDFIHALMGRDMAQVRAFLSRIEKYAASLDDAERQAPSVAGELDELARDSASRERYLRFVRTVETPAVRARMVALARSLGWLSADEKRSELIRMVAERVTSDAVGPADVDLVCGLNKDGELDLAPDDAGLGAPSTRLSHAAVMACLGSVDDHARVVRALASHDDRDVQIAQVYLRHRPIADVRELRAVSAAVAEMSGSDAQVRALDTLAGHRLSDRESLLQIAQLFSAAGSVSVQTAVAGVLIRADYPSDAKPDLARMLRRDRLRTTGGEDLIDVLIRRLQSAP